MATSGDTSCTSNRGGRRFAAVLAALFSLLALSFPLASAGGSVRSRANARADTGVWCQAPLDGAWKEVLKTKALPISLSGSLLPMAFSNDAHSLYASLFTDGFYGVAKVDVASGRYTPIHRFAKPQSYQAGDGSFDGRWLIWREDHSYYDNVDFSIWSWDSRTGKVKQIGASERSPSGSFWPSAWQGAFALDGYATWEVGSGPNGLGDVHVFNLRTGRDRVVYRGHVGGSFLIDGPRVVWPESLKPNELTVMRTIDVKTGKIVATPPVLRSVRGALVPVTDGKAVAYASDEWYSLWWSPSLDTEPRRVFKASSEFIQNGVRIHGHYVSFTVWPNQYLADTSSGRYLRVALGGGAVIGSKSIAVMKWGKMKQLHPHNPVVVLPLNSLPPVPPCK